MNKEVENAKQCIKNSCEGLALETIEKYYNKEIERLNNIIEELEKDMRETIEIIKNTEYQKIDIDYVIETFDIYCNRLKELKEGK